MAFRFQKRIKLGKGLGLNLSKSGISPSYRTKKGSLSSKGFSIKTGISGLTYRKKFKKSGCIASFIFFIMLSVAITSCEADEDCRCSDYATQAAAQAALNDGCEELDRDNDGIACENLPN